MKSPDRRSQARLEAAARQLRELLDAGDATQGMEVGCRRGGIVLSWNWLDTLSAEPEPDPRFRLTPLGSGQFGLSLYRHGRWGRLPFFGTLAELVEVMNTVLAPWAAQPLPR